MRVGRPRVGHSSGWRSLPGRCRCSRSSQLLPSDGDSLDGICPEVGHLLHSRLWAGALHAGLPPDDMM
jgi:hypothetical protein